MYEKNPKVLFDKNPFDITVLLKGVQFPFNHHFGNFCHIGKQVIDDNFGFRFDLFKSDAFLGNYLSACHEWLINGFSYLGKQPYIDVLHFWDFLYYITCHLSR